MNHNPILQPIAAHFPAQWDNNSTKSDTTDWQTRLPSPSPIRFISTAQSMQRASGRLSRPSGRVSSRVRPPSQYTFGFYFDSNGSDLSLPSCLERLTFASCFNQPVNHLHLPSSLRELTFGAEFNQRLDEVHFPS